MHLVVKALVAAFLVVNAKNITFRGTFASSTTFTGTVCFPNGWGTVSRISPRLRLQSGDMTRGAR